MHAKLFCEYGKLKGQKVNFTESATIGRSQNSTLSLNMKSISGTHAKITFDKNDNCYYLEDLSSNGTKLDGAKLTKGRKEKLGSLHVITFAEFDFFFLQEQGEFVEAEKETPVKEKPAKVSGDTQQDVWDDPPPVASKIEDSQQTEGKTAVDSGDFAMPNIHIGVPDEPKHNLTQIDEDIVTPDIKLPTQPPTAEPVKPISVQKSKFQFIIEDSDKSYELKEGKNTIGRTPDCDITISDTSISRKHACITIDSGKATIKDLGSKNKTIVNGSEVIEEIELKIDSEIKIGSVIAIFKSK